MKLGFISDIHDNLPNLKKALDALAIADELICLGDLCSPFVMKALGSGYAKPIHLVYGNNDGDLYRLTEVSKAFPQIQLYGEFAELERGGRAIAINHFDTIGRALAKGATYDLVAFGHNHQFEISNTGKTTTLNPGEVYGGLTGSATCAIYNVEDNSIERIDIN